MHVKNNSNSLTVLHIASGDLWAGAEVQLFTLVKTLQTKLNIHINVVLLNHGELESRLREIGTKTIVLDESRLNWLQITRLLIRTIKDVNPDVIHTHRRKENILGSMSALLANQIPCIRTAHGNPPRPQIWDFSRWIIRQCDLLTGRFLQRYIISVSDDLAEILSKDYPAIKIRVIDNGLDDNIFTKLNLDNLAKKNVSNTLKIGIACRLSQIKRVDLFIQTAQYIKEHYPHLKNSFHILGDGPLRESLEKLSVQLNTNNIVHFEGHCIDIYDKLQELDVLLITSDHEGLPMVLLEAMALHTPIIAHDIGGITKVLDNGSCGILVQEHSAIGYASAIYKLFESPEILASMTKNAAQRVQSSYTAEKNARTYFSTYSELIQ